MVIREASHSLLHLFYPHVCAGCGTDVLSREQLLCIACLHRLPVSSFHSFAGNPIEKIFRGRLPIRSAASYLYFTKDSLLQHLLHQFKYRGKKQIGLFFGNRIAEALLQSDRFSTIDALVPLPLFPGRERRRGFNQARILCEGITGQWRLPVLQQVITRPSPTETQTHKNRIQRWQNIAGRFVLNDAAAISGKHILLVDDVITTGATLEACGQELLKAPGVQLSIATMAFTAR